MHAAMNQDVTRYNEGQSPAYRKICEQLAHEMCGALPESEHRVWHGHPVWFLAGNPIAGYAKRKSDVQVLFWSGQSFDEPGLKGEGSFKAAEIRYSSTEQINTIDLRRWLSKSIEIQWDYKNIVKRKGVLERLR